MILPFYEIGIEHKCCEERDPKGLFHKIRDGKIQGFNGIKSLYEDPVRLDVVFDTNTAPQSELITQWMKVVV